MKSFAAAIVLIAFCASAFQTANAFRSAEMVEAVIDQQVCNNIFMPLLSNHDFRAYVLLARSLLYVFPVGMQSLTYGMSNRPFLCRARTESWSPSQAFSAEA